MEEGQSPSALWAARQQEGSVLRCRREEGDGRRQFGLVPVRAGAATQLPSGLTRGRGDWPSLRRACWQRLWVPWGWLRPVSPVRS